MIKASILLKSTLMECLKKPVKNCMKIRILVLIISADDVLTESSQFNIGFYSHSNLFNERGLA